MEPRIQYARTVDGVNIAFWTLGQGLPCVEMPPLPWSHLQAEWQDPDYRRWYERLAQGCRLIRYDGRGSGLSDRTAPSWGPEAHLYDLEAVVDKLGLERFALVGVSTSGALAIAYAALHPERVSRLVLWCAFANTADLSASLVSLESLRDTDWPLYTETIAHAMVAGWTAPDAARRFAALMREATDHDTFVAILAESSQFDVTELLPKVSQPTLVLQRQGGRIPSPEAARGLAAAIPDARLALLEGDAILPFVGDMEAAARAIEDFLAEGDHDQPPEPVSFAGGLATILFTDIEGHTEIMQRLGDEAGRVFLREHERITREALREFGGTEVKAMGDGFMAWFSHATRALECSVAMQQAFGHYNAEHPETLLKVRIGLNAGEPIAEGDDLFGAAVIMAARISATAKGGEVLTSLVVRELVAGKGFLFADHGETLLRGFEDPVRVYQLRWQEER